MNLGELIVRTLKEEVVPAMGCTEPVAIALACAKASDLVEHSKIDKLEIVIPTIFDNSLSFIFLLASITSRFIIIAIIELFKLLGQSVLLIYNPL